MLRLQQFIGSLIDVTVSFFLPDQGVPWKIVILCVLNLFFFTVGCLILSVGLRYIHSMNWKTRIGKRLWLRLVIVALLSLSVIWLAAIGGPGAGHPILKKLYVPFRLAFALDTLSTGTVHGWNYLLRTVALLAYCFAVRFPTFYGRRLLNQLQRYADERNKTEGKVNQAKAKAKAKAEADNPHAEPDKAEAGTNPVDAENLSNKYAFLTLY